MRNRESVYFPERTQTEVSIPTSILVGTTNKIVWIKVEGKGSFLNSAGVKEFAKEMVNRGHREFVVDLRHCPVMDSTFMGTLAMIALRLREIGQGSLHVVNLNERNHDLLTNLGLDQLFSMDACGVREANPAVSNNTLQPAPSADHSVQAETMLEAHQALVEADPDNLTKFKDVLEYLKQDLHRAE
jgi:anti-sigma B factor antagonist